MRARGDDINLFFHLAEALANFIFLDVKPNMKSITKITGLEKTQTPRGVIKRCHKALDSMKTITQNSVNDLSEKNKTLLRENTPARMKELAQLNCLAADKVKTTLDKKYGEHNYVLIAVGRSVSSIVELAGKWELIQRIFLCRGLGLCPLKEQISKRKTERHTETI